MRPEGERTDAIVWRLILEYPSTSEQVTAKAVHEFTFGLISQILTRRAAVKFWVMIGHLGSAREPSIGSTRAPDVH